MIQYELNYVDERNKVFEERTFYDLGEALAFIEASGDNLTYYNLWEVNLKIIKSNGVEKK